MKIGIHNFRCFHSPAPVNLRPINVLVGENSSGKTSFLAATRFLLDLFGRDKNASFNREPFFLGAYDQIAHLRGGSVGRAKNFSFSMTVDLPRSTRNTVQPELFEPARLGTERIPSLDVEVSFFNNKSQPAIEKISISSNFYGIEANFRDEFSLNIRTPSGESRLFRDSYSRDLFDPMTLDISYLQFVLRDHRIISSESRELSNDVRLSEIRSLSSLLNSVFRAVPRNIYASAPVRSKPDRTYNPSEATTTPDGSHTPFILAQLHAFDRQKWQALQSALSDFGDASGLFSSVNIKQVGSSSSGPFQIIVSMKNRKSNLIDVGYGISQVLPLISELIRAPSGSIFLFQQPEVHLHPRAQAELATFMLEIAKRRRHMLLIETHSDYIIDRFRMAVRDGSAKSSDISLLYFERTGPDVDIQNIDVDKNGNMIGCPPSYRRFFLEEEMRSLGIENQCR